MSMAQLSLLGTLWSDPELGYSSLDRAVTAITVKVTQKNGKTHYFDCLACENLAERINEQVTQGQQVYVQGEYYRFECSDEYTQRTWGSEIDVLDIQQFHVVEHGPDGTSPSDPHDWAGKEGNRLEMNLAPGGIVKEQSRGRRLTQLSFSVVKEQSLTGDLARLSFSIVEEDHSPLAGDLAQLSFLGVVLDELETSCTPDGKAITTFRVEMIGRLDNEETVYWVQCRAIHDVIEQLHEQVRPGQQLFVLGECSQQTWTDENGQPDSGVTVQVEKLRLLGRSSKNPPGFHGSCVLEEVGVGEDLETMPDTDGIGNDHGHARGMAQLSLLGTVCSHPERNTAPDGRVITTFVVGVTRQWENQETTQQFNCLAYGELGELIKQQVRSGQQVYVQGEYDRRGWRDERDRIHRTLEVSLETLQVLDSHANASALSSGPKFVEKLGEEVEGDNLFLWFI